MTPPGPPIPASSLGRQPIGSPQRPFPSETLRRPGETPAPPRHESSRVFLRLPPPLGLRRPRESLPGAPVQTLSPAFQTAASASPGQALQAMEPPKEPVSGGGLDPAAPGPGVAKGSPSKAKPAPARASPKTRAKAPLAKKAPKKAAQIPPKALGTVGAAGEKEPERPRVDGAAPCSASQPQPLQPPTPSPTCPPEGDREELSHIPVMEAAEPSSLPPASTPSEEPAAKATPEAPKEPVCAEKMDLAAPKPGAAKGAPSTAKPAPTRTSPRVQAKAPPAKKATQIPPKSLGAVDTAAKKEQEPPLVDRAASASQPSKALTKAGETPSPTCPPDGGGEQLSQPQLPVMKPAEPSSLPTASTPLPPESPSEEPAVKRAKLATPEAPKEQLSAEKLDLAAPKPGVAKGAPSTAKPALPRVLPRAQPKAPPAKKAAKKPAQIPQKALGRVDAAAVKEQERPRVDGAAASSASQQLQPLTEAGEMPSPPEGTRKELSQPQLPVMESAEPSSLPPASTPLPLESPSEEPAAKRAKPATPEATLPPAVAASPASDNALQQGHVTASSMDILESLSVVEGPKNLSLCGDKGSTQGTPTFKGLFNPAVFAALLQKAKASAQIVVHPAASDPTLSDLNNLLFSEPNTDEEIPCPKLFLDVVQRQWIQPGSSANPSSSDKRFYNVTPNLLTALKVPTIDGPVASLVSPNVLSNNPENGLKPEDKRMELALRRSHNMGGWAVKSAVAASFFNRTSLLWLKEMQARIPATDSQTHEDINNLIAAAEFSADATLNSVKFTSRAMGLSLTARRLLWLRHWNSDIKCKWKLASAAFKGENLFGEFLEPLLVENKDKKKVLPPKYKPDQRAKFQKPSFRAANKAHNFSQPQKAYFQQRDRQSDRAGYGDRSRQQFQSKRPFQGNGGQPFHGSSRGLHSQSSQIQPSRGPPATGDFRPKGFEEVKSNSRLKNTQQASGTQEIQNPVPQIHTGQYPVGRLPEVNRSQGNIPTRPYIVDSPTISRDMRRDMPVQSSHKDTSYALSAPQDYPYSHPTLSGRHVDRIRLSPPRNRGPPHHDPGPSESFMESGIHSQQQQEPLVSYRQDAPPSSIYRDDMRSLPVTGSPAQHQRSGEPHPIGPTNASRPRLTIVRQDGVLRLHLSRPTSAYQDPDGRQPVVIRGHANQLQLARAQSMSHSTPTDPDPHLWPPYTDPSRQHSQQDPYEPPREQPLQDIDYRTQDPIRSPPSEVLQGKHIEETEPSRYRSRSRFSQLESPDRNADGTRLVDRRGTTQERHPDTDYRRLNPIQSPPVADVTDRNQGKHVRETEPFRHRSGVRFSQLESPDGDRDGRRSADRRGTTQERQSTSNRSRPRSPQKDRDHHRWSSPTDSSRQRRP